MVAFRDILSGAKPSFRALKTIFFGEYAEDAFIFAVLKPRARGFYVDVGAYHPIEGSNTYKLYLKGWHGITIEPNPHTARLFHRIRPRDHHVTCGVAREAAHDMVWHEFAYPTLNTFSAERAAGLQRAGFPCTGTQKIAVRPLQEIVDAICPEKHIDLLLIDCEGMDLEVLQSFDCERLRPPFILIEDWDGYRATRDRTARSPIGIYMEKISYRPIAQLFYSFFYVADDWREQMEKDRAFDMRLD